MKWGRLVSYWFELERECKELRKALERAENKLGTYVEENDIQRQSIQNLSKRVAETENYLDLLIKSIQDYFENCRVLECIPNITDRERRLEQMDSVCTSLDPSKCFRTRAEHVLITIKERRKG